MSKEKTEGVHCNWCRHKTLHRLLKSVHVKDEVEFDETSTYICDSKYDLLQCCGCSTVRMRNTYEDPSGQVEVAFYPPSITRHPPHWPTMIPLDLYSMLHEVYRALGAECNRLALIGTRTLMDMVILKEVGDVGPFSEKLEALEKKGVLSQKNSEVLSAVLDAGSAAAHRGFNPKLENVHAVLDIVENLLSSLYVVDKLAERIKKVTPQRPKRVP